MIRTIECRHCKKAKKIEYNGGKSIIDNGYNFIFDISNGLTTIHLCNECTEIIREHIKAIEDFMDIQIDYLNLGNLSSK